MADETLMDMQVPQGVPTSSAFQIVSDPLIPNSVIDTKLAHFPPEIYDLSDGSHLMRMLSVLLGDAGVGQLRKRWTYTHLASYLRTAQYADIDAFYANVFGFYRLLREQMGGDPLTMTRTDSDWEAIDIAEGAYRSRVATFARGLTMAGTPLGMALIATAVVGYPCRIYETYTDLDNGITNTPPAAWAHTYEQMEWYTYGSADAFTYAQIEGQSFLQGQFNNRAEFVVRPGKSVSPEERLHLLRILNRLKPVNSVVTVDDNPSTLFTKVDVQSARASSSYWHVQPSVLVAKGMEGAYQESSPTYPVEQPHPAMSTFTGKSWSYSDASVVSYVENEDGIVIQNDNWERSTDEQGAMFDFTADLALMDADTLARAEAVSDGNLTATLGSA